MLLCVCTVNFQIEECNMNPEPAINHSQLAMQAARRMRRVKHKQKNSRVICHHLSKMLMDAEVGVRPHSAEILLAPLPRVIQQEKQFSLGF